MVKLTYLTSLMEPALSLFFPHTLRPLAKRTMNSPFFSPTAIISPSGLKATDLAGPTDNLANNA